MVASALKLRTGWRTSCRSAMFIFFDEIRDALEKVSGEILQNTENAGVNDAAFRRVEKEEVIVPTHHHKPSFNNYQS